MTAPTAEVRVDSAGMGACLQDRGRVGLASSGVSPSGAFDRAAADRANRLVGNAATAAVIEAVGGGLQVTAIRSPLVVAVTGAAGAVRLGSTPHPRDTALRLPLGATLHVDPPTTGLRSYLAVRGGFAVPPTLGSRSWDSLGRLGPPPLQAADRIPVGPPQADLPSVERAPRPLRADDTAPLRVTPGPRFDWFTEETWQTLLAAEFAVLPASSRIGVRLAGPALSRTADRADLELPPEPVLRGGIQVPPDGQPIILGPDCPVTGGYPVIAVVDEADLDRCAQLAPGVRTRFSATLFAGR